jgi:hypothetical protein
MPPIRVAWTWRCASTARLYLFEFKVVELTPEGRALQQIKDRGYADKYRAEGLPIHLIGVEFSREQRSVVGFEVESCSPALLRQAQHTSGRYGVGAGDGIGLAESPRGLGSHDGL